MIFPVIPIDSGDIQPELSYLQGYDNEESTQR